MKHIKLWIQGWFEYLLEIVLWPVFAPYYKAITMNEAREHLKKIRKEQAAEIMKGEL